MQYLHGAELITGNPQISQVMGEILDKNMTEDIDKNMTIALKSWLEDWEVDISTTMNHRTNQKMVLSKAEMDYWGVEDGGMLHGAEVHEQKRCGIA